MQVTVVKIEANVQWSARQSDTSARWIGECAPMNMAMEADTLDELHEVINETMQLLLTDLLRDNELDGYLRARGWNASDLGGIDEDEEVQFDVPWEMITKGRMIDPQRRAH